MGLLNLTTNTAVENGTPVAGARRFVYIAGTDTLARLYTDAGLTRLQANPMAADAAGDFPICHLVEGDYRIVLEDASGRRLSSNAARVGTPLAALLSEAPQSVQDLLNSVLLSYGADRGHHQVRGGEVLPLADGSASYLVVAADEPDYHLVSATGVRFRVLPEDGGFDPRAFGAMGDGVTDDTAAVQAAIDAGGDVAFSRGTYRVTQLSLTHADQRLSASGYVILQKNADGPLLSGSADRITIDGLIFRGGTSDTPEFTGDNIVISGNGFQFLRSASYWCQGRAIKATGAHALIADPVDIIATADISGSGYDIELGQSGTATLYHRISNWYAGHFYGGLLLVDTGSHMLSNSLFGKLTIAKGTGPSGSNGGMTSVCRIGGDITVEASNAIFAGNQPSSANCHVTFAAGTSTCRWDASNTSPASITNAGNANNLILRETSDGAVSRLKRGDDSWGDGPTVDNAGQWSFPHQITLEINMLCGSRTTPARRKTRSPCPRAMTGRLGPIPAPIS